MLWNPYVTQTVSLDYLCKMALVENLKYIAHLRVPKTLTFKMRPSERKNNLVLIQRPRELQKKNHWSALFQKWLFGPCNWHNTWREASAVVHKNVLWGIQYFVFTEVTIRSVPYVQFWRVRKDGFVLNENYYCLQLPYVASFNARALSSWSSLHCGCVWINSGFIIQLIIRQFDQIDLVSSASNMAFPFLKM